MSVTQLPHTTSPADVWYLDIADIEFYFGSQSFDPVDICEDGLLLLRFPPEAALTARMPPEAALTARMTPEVALRLRC